MTKSGRSSPAGARRILVVDDHPMLRHGLREIVEPLADLDFCGEAEDAASAVEQFNKLQPDLVLVDISLRQGDGLELIKQIKALSDDAKMLVCSMHDEKIYAERCLQAGARGYVNKQEPTEVLLGAIRRVLDGAVYLSPDMSQRMLERVAGGDKELTGSPVDNLSDRELEVLQLIGQGLGTRQIAERLNLSVKTIDTYRENLKTKLNVRTANELIRYAVIWSQEQT